MGFFWRICQNLVVLLIGLLEMCIINAEGKENQKIGNLKSRQTLSKFVGGKNVASAWQAPVRVNKVIRTKMLKAQQMLSNLLIVMEFICCLCQSKWICFISGAGLYKSQLLQSSVHPWSKWVMIHSFPKQSIKCSLILQLFHFPNNSFQSSRI